MGGFSAKYSEEQRRAIALAIVDGVPGVVGRAKNGTCTAPQACELAAAGQLPGMAPFTMHLQTARHYATRERTRRAEQEAEKLRDGVGGILDGVALDLARLATREVSKLKRQTAGQGLDIGKATAVAKLVQEARKAAGPGAAPGKSADLTDAPKEGLAQRLAAAEAQARAEQSRAQDASPTHKDTGTTDDTQQTGTGRPATKRLDDQDGTEHAIPVSSEARGSGDALALAQAALSRPAVAG